MYSRRSIAIVREDSSLCIIAPEDLPVGQDKEVEDSDPGPGYAQGSRPHWLPGCSLRPRAFHLVAVRNEAGKKLAQQIKQEVRQEVEEWMASGNKWPHLSRITISVSENPASPSYFLNKIRAAVGINSETISHQCTPEEQLKKHTILADTVISAAGIPNPITADMIKEGAAVTDVETNRVHEKLHVNRFPKLPF
uniref:bifunctional methylenetetrahydrofolate dehydrogenase/cyclohydrolase, mitochondrial-like n=1 Tax=Callithrix jacchus TaxID=9483 RepID=UPI0023DD4949|nr:bifunctional methylenetetrahydrofolate dehydrogenase/cyclohydrolase, mitochondrial-like [Callithrix jacchus]